MGRTILAVAVLGFSCTESTAERLVIVSVGPSSATNDVATPVVISGKGFYSEAAVSFDDSGELPVDDTFEATLGSTVLEAVEAVDAETLAATVPAGVGPGVYAITVKVPSGEIATLADAFTVEDPPLVPRLEIETLSLAPSPDASTGDLLTLTYVVANNGRVTATDVTVPEPVPLGTVASAAPPPDHGSSPPSVAEIAPSVDVNFTRKFIATGAGTLSFSARATGFDANTGIPTASTSVESNAITVARATSLVVSFDADRTRVSEGQSIALTMTVVNNGEVAASSVTPTSLAPGGTAGFLLSNPSPLSMASLAGGASDSFTWTVTTAAGDAGELSFTGAASGTNAISGATVTATPVSTPGMLIQTRPSLTLSTDAPLVMGRFQNGVLVRLEVINSGGAAANVSDADLQITGPEVNKFTITPTLTAVPVPGGDSRDLTFRVDVADPAEGDTYTADGQIVAADANDPSFSLDINFGGGTPDTFTIGAADLTADLSIVVEIVAPPGATDGTVSTLQSFTVRAVVVNSGSCNITGGEVTLALGATGATGSNLTVPLVLSQPIEWELTASATANGPNDLRVGITDDPVHETCAGDPTLPATPSTQSLITVDRAHLVIDATLLPPADDGRVDLGEQFQLEVRVDNTGTAGVAGAAELEVDPGDLLLMLDTPGSLTQPFVADNTPVTFTFTASPDTTSSDDLTATIVTIPNDENTGADAHADPSSVSLPLVVVDPNAWANDCERCGGANRCRDDCSDGCPVCATGCTCEMACQSSGNCSTTCDANSSCAVASNGGDGDPNVVCNDAVCLLECNGVDGSCRLECNGSSQCQLRCNDVEGTCRIRQCPVAELTNCGEGDWACRASCP